MPNMIHETQYECHECDFITTRRADLNTHPHSTTAFRVQRCADCGEIRYATDTDLATEHECIDQ